MTPAVRSRCGASRTSPTGSWRHRRSPTSSDRPAPVVTPSLTACGGDAPADDASGSITVWSLENQPDRVLATQKIADEFTAKSGIQVKIVATDENQFTSLITTAAASGEMPDVVGALP